MKLNNKEYRTQYENQGYLQIPFLDECQLKLIKNLVAEKISISKSDDFVFSNNKMTMEALYEMNDALNNIIKPSLERLMNDYDILFTVVASKNNTTKSKINYHTDRCYVDEIKFTPHNFWIPLCDITDNNGSFGVMEGSHKFTFTWRGINNFEYYKKKEYIDYIEKNCIKYLYPKAGEAIIYHPGIIHGSLENKSDSVRHVLLMTLMPKSGELIYCYKNFPNFNFIEAISVFEANKNFWIKNDIPNPTGILKFKSLQFNKKPKITLQNLENYANNHTLL